ncbi:Hemicentin-2 [Oryzias melastigma]|uniref:Hemicentin-2 n=1 Tax=Oryzias melastigma TaxID=30732 RepID=A0A834BVJ3_ORYME|nr:Hemicentin-2 [Oryzias melastigma]
MLEDEGRYMCYSSILAGKEEFFVNLKVYAPVQDITIQHLENEIICSSDGIYPEPTLTWTPDQTNQKIRLTQTEQKLYSIRSSVPSADSMDVTCTVSTPAGRRRATLKSTVHENILGTETSISSNLTPFTMYIWRFNHSEEMVRGTPQGPHSPTEKWQQHIVESSLEKLTLKQLQPNLTGIYTCEVWSDQETFIKSFFLHVTEDNNMNTIGIIVGVVVADVLIAVAVVVVVCCSRKKSKNKQSTTLAERKKLNQDKTDNRGFLDHTVR